MSVTGHGPLYLKQPQPLRIISQLFVSSLHFLPLFYLQNWETSLSLLPMKRRKAWLSEEELSVKDKVNKASKRASEIREQTLHMQARTEPNTYDTYHTACAESSALQCCSFYMDYRRLWCFHFHILNIQMAISVNSEKITKTKSVLQHQEQFINHFTFHIHPSPLTFPKTLP